MNKETIIDILSACGIRNKVIDLDDGWQIVVSNHGGHIYGPFSSSCPKGISWMPVCFQSKEAFRAAIRSQTWNTGGDRVWIAPEIQFNITDREHFRETLKTPATIDPGNFEWEEDDNSVWLRQHLELEAHNTVTGSIRLDFKRIVQKADNPLRKLADFNKLMSGVGYCGYEQTLDLECSNAPGIYAEAWDLHQIRPKGTLFIPMYHTERGTDHYEPAGEKQRCVEQGICLEITGDTRYKIAYKSACLTGRFAYLAESETDETYMIVKNYPNNPSCHYSEEPPLIEGDRGYSIHVYNDNGNSGGFAEMECNLQTIGEPTGLYHSIDRLTTWFFTGKTEALKKISEYLLGYGWE